MWNLQTERAHLDPLPDLFGDRAEESQLGQLLRWIAWASKVQIKHLTSSLGLSTQGFYNATMVGGANNEFIADLQVWFRRSFDIAVDALALRALAAKPIGDLDWHQLARDLRASANGQVMRRTSQGIHGEPGNEAPDDGKDPAQGSVVV